MNIKKLIKDLIPYIIIIVIVVLVRAFIVTPVKVTGSSMDPTLKGKEVMILNKLGHIDRFDIVVLKVDLENDNLIKRVIALPGETIKIENNTIYINGEELDENFGVEYTSDYPETKLKSDEYFLLGDNRIVSLDSRIFGPVKEKDIKGTTNFVIYPFNSFGKVK